MSCYTEMQTFTNLLGKESMYMTLILSIAKQMSSIQRIKTPVNLIVSVKIGDGE